MYGPACRVSASIERVAECPASHRFAPIGDLPLLPSLVQVACRGAKHCADVALFNDEAPDSVAVAVIGVGGFAHRGRLVQPVVAVVAVAGHCSRQDPVCFELQSRVEFAVLLAFRDDHIERDDAQATPDRFVVAGHLRQVVSDEQRCV